VRLAAALLVPWLGASLDQFNFFIPLRLWHGTPFRDFGLSEEPVMIDLHRVDTALTAKIERLDVFISHDAAGDRRYTSVPGLRVKVSLAL
jgi:hypothetical protein